LDGASLEEKPSKAHSHARDNEDKLSSLGFSNLHAIFLLLLIVLSSLNFVGSFKKENLSFVIFFFVLFG